VKDHITEVKSKYLLTHKKIIIQRLNYATQSNDTGKYRLSSEFVAERPENKDGMKK
jgi:hypothetical protein